MPVEEIQIKNIGGSTISASQIRMMYRNTGFQGKNIINKITQGISTFGFLKLIRG